MLGEFGQLLRAVVNGPDPATIPAPSEVIPTIELGNCAPSWKWSRSTFLYAGYAIEANAGGVRSQVALFNPSDSGVIATITHQEGRGTLDAVLLTSATAADVAAFDNDGAERGRDARCVLGTAPNRVHTCRIISDQAAQAGDALIRLFADMYDGATYYTFHHDVPYVLLPGSAIVALPTGDDNGLVWSFAWEERRLDPGELRGTRAGQYGV